MADLRREPMAQSHLNDILEWLDRYPQITTGSVSRMTKDGRLITLRVTPRV